MKTRLTILLFVICFVAQGQQDQFAFLRSHTADISTEVANPFFDTAFYRNQFFFFGENHGFARPQQTDYNLFTHLHQKAGVKHYIAEVDFTKAWLLNRFLANGDTTLLDKVFASWKRDTAQWANREHYQKWKRLQRYQQSLPARARITVVGVDVLQDEQLVAAHLRELTTSKKFGALQPMFDSLNTVAATANRAEIIAFSKRFYPLVDSARSSLRKTLGNNYAALHHLLKSLTLLNAGNNRDKVMYLNLTNQLALFGWEKNKLYGFLGFYHCLQTSYNKSMPMAAHLKQSAMGNRGIVTMAMLVLDSEIMLPLAGPIRQMMPKANMEKMLREHPEFGTSQRYIPFAMSNDNSMMKVDGVDLLKGLSTPSSVHLFKLTGEGSPYSATKALGEVKGMQTVAMTNANEVTTNAFQYVVLFRNTKAATPLE